MTTKTTDLRATPAPDEHRQVRLRTDDVFFICDALGRFARVPTSLDVPAVDGLSPRQERDVARFLVDGPHVARRISTGSLSVREWRVVIRALAVCAARVLVERLEGERDFAPGWQSSELTEVGTSIRLVEEIRTQTGIRP